MLNSSVASDTMKNKKPIFGKIPKSNRKIVEKGQTDTSNSQIHDHLL